MPRRVAAFSPPSKKKKPYIRDVRDRTRPTASARGYNSKQWYALRKQALLRDNYQCRSCGCVCGRKGEAQVDHIIPKQDGGLDELSNLQVLCIACHGRKTNEEQRRWKSDRLRTKDVPESDREAEA